MGCSPAFLTDETGAVADLVEAVVLVVAGAAADLADLVEEASEAVELGEAGRVLYFVRSGPLRRTGGEKTV